jgi:hypothetical protein
MRKGQNPSKDSLPAYQPEKLGIALVSYIPTLVGYFEHSLEVLKYEIASLHHSTGVEFDLYLFDNGSCAEVQAELFRLHNDGWIDFLFSSRHNLGKIGTMNWILGAVPNELICYADSDVLFRPGWFEHSLAIFEAYPRVGLVSAQPCLDDVLHARGQAQAAFDNDPAYRVEFRLVEARYVEEYATGFGYTADQCAALKKNQYKFITHLQSGVQAVVGATHVQFIIPRDVARQVGTLPATMSLSRQEDRNFNQAVDRLGYYHLSTLEPYYYHVGNVPDQNVLAEVTRMDLERMFQEPPKPAPSRPGWVLGVLRKFSHLPLLRSVIYRTYKLLFELYS